MEYESRSAPGASYRLGRRLKSGSSSEIFETRHPVVPGAHAIKVLRTSLTDDPEAVEAFLADIHAVAALRHPNVVHVVEATALPGGPTYVVMELLEGRVLAERLASRRAIPAMEAVQITKAVAAALQAAHSRGVVHGEINPSNVFLARTEGYDQGVVKLLNFGMARLRPLGAVASLPVEAARFLSPEQAAGHVDDVDARSDQFALAALAHRMLSGSDAVKGGSVLSLIYGLVHGETAVKTPAPEVEAVIQRGLAHDKAERYETVVAFARALETAVSSSEVTAVSATGAKHPGADARTPVVASSHAMPAPQATAVGPAYAPPVPVSSAAAHARTVAAPLLNKQASGGRPAAAPAAPPPREQRERTAATDQTARRRWTFNISRLRRPIEGAAMTLLGFASTRGEQEAPAARHDPQPPRRREPERPRERERDRHRGGTAPAMQPPHRAAAAAPPPRPAAPPPTPAHSPPPPRAIVSRTPPPRAAAAAAAQWAPPPQARPAKPRTPPPRGGGYTGASLPSAISPQHQQHQAKGGNGGAAPAGGRVPGRMDSLLMEPFFDRFPSGVYHHQAAAADYDDEMPVRRRSSGVGKFLFLMLFLGASSVGVAYANGWRAPLAWRQSTIWHTLRLPDAATPPLAPAAAPGTVPGGTAKPAPAAE